MPEVLSQWDVILLAVAIAGAAYAWHKKEKIVMEGV